MASLEDEIRDIREKNSELAVEIQHWKELAAQREREKIDLMKDLNELRLKLSRMRSCGAAEAQKLDSALQAASEEVLSHLVQASGTIARSVELTKQYLRDRQELESASPRWSSLNGTTAMTSTDKVHRVPPTLVGGQSIQPVVSLSRTMLNSSSRARTPNPNVTERAAVPVHLLSDVYIPLTRINIDDLNLNTEDNEVDNSTEDLENDVNTEESHELSEEYDTSRRLDVVMEDMEAEEDTQSQQRDQNENPLEGPSWLLDIGGCRPSQQSEQTTSGNGALPDSTTCETAPASTRIPSPPIQTLVSNHNESQSERQEEQSYRREVFTPTVRRRKRTVTSPLSPVGAGLATPSTPKLQRVQTGDTPSPHFSPIHFVRNKNKKLPENRVLKVMVAKLHVSGRASGDQSPLRHRHSKQQATPPDDGLVLLYSRSSEPVVEAENLATHSRDLEDSATALHTSPTRIINQSSHRRTDSPSSDSSSESLELDTSEYKLPNHKTRRTPPAANKDASQSSAGLQGEQNVQGGRSSNRLRLSIKREEKRSRGEANVSQQEDNISRPKNSCNRHEVNKNRHEDIRNRQEDNRNRPEDNRNRHEDDRNRHEDDRNRLNDNLNRDDGLHQNEESLDHHVDNLNRHEDNLNRHGDNSNCHEDFSHNRRRKGNRSRREVNASREEDHLRRQEYYPLVDLNDPLHGSHVDRTERSLSRHSHQSASDSDSSMQLAEGRSRRQRKVVVYKEKPLNRKLRR